MIPSQGNYSNVSCSNFPSPSSPDGLRCFLVCLYSPTPPYPTLKFPVCGNSNKLSFLCMRFPIFCPYSTSNVLLKQFICILKQPCSNFFLQTLRQFLTYLCILCLISIFSHMQWGEVGNVNSVLGKNSYFI